MKRIKPTKKTVFLLIVVLAIGIFFFNSSQADFTYRSRTNLSQTDLTKLRKEWKKTMDKMGPEEAYQEIVKRYENERFVEKHNAVHLFGEVLYDSLGFDGVLVCDRAYAWGCFHGMFLKAIAEKGVDSINQFYDACTEESGSDNLGCQHGIGHALGEYYGPDNLVEQLEICNSLEWHGPIGCAGGVFMEYNLPGWFGLEASSSLPREFDNKKPYYPCLDLPENFTDACVFRLGEWLLEIYDFDVKKAQDVCLKTDEKHLRQTCLIGVGAPLVEAASYNSEEVSSLCSMSGKGEPEFFCRVGASWWFLTSEDVESSNELCRFDEQCLEEVNRFIEKVLYFN